MNVIRDTLAAYRWGFYQRCWVTLLTTGGYIALWYVDWRIALAIFALMLARNTRAALRDGGML
jgi:hypothetical protein